MPTFIDESGDTGPCADPSHCYFRLAAVWVPSHEEVDAIRTTIREVRARLMLRSDYEFKFSKTWHYPDRRDAFFHAVLRHDFRYAFAAVDKTQPTCRNAGKELIHWATATELAAALRPTYLTAHQNRNRMQSQSSRPLKEQVLVDDNEDKQFLATVTKQFRGLGQGCAPKAFLVGKVKFRDSQPEELMQLVDMVCGACGANLDGDNRWHQIIAERSLSSKKERADQR